jgi:predicted dehydrogenase
MKNATLRGAIIGFGDVARNGHWPAYEASREARIVAIMDRSEERRRLASEKVGAFSSIEELAKAEPMLDFVDICTPPALHGEQILTALANDWNVLCEKPLLLDLVELEKVRALARERERAVVPLHNWKFAPIIRGATELLRSSKIGSLREVEIETLRIKDCATADPERPNWRRDPAIAGGGILFDHGWHAIYLAQHWFGEQPIGVEASLHRPAADAVEDEVRLTINFPGGLAKIFLTWNADVRRNRMRLIGEGNEIVIDDDTLRIGADATTFKPGLSAGSHHADWFATMLPEILGYFRDPKAAEQVLNEAAVCLSVIRRAYEMEGVGTAASSFRP